MFQSYFTSSEAYPSFKLGEETLQTFAIVSCRKENIFYWTEVLVPWECLNFSDLSLKLILMILGSVLNSSNHNSHSASVAEWQILFRGQVVFLNHSQGCSDDCMIGVDQHNWLNTSNSCANSGCNPLFMQYLVFLFIIITDSCLQLRACIAINFVVQA